MKDYQKEFQMLKENGMVFSGVKKVFVGKVDKAAFFNGDKITTNTFGYYRTDNNKWAAFITDDERGYELIRKEVETEEAAVKYLMDRAEGQHFIDYCNSVMSNFDNKEKLIVEHLKAEYGYSDTKAQKALNYLLQVKIIAFEYAYLIEKGDFVPDKYASVFSGYTTRRISEETELTILGAFNYMVYLKQKPDEALERLKAGLPAK